MENASNNQALIDVVRQLDDVDVIKLEAPDVQATVLSVPAGRTLHSVKKYLDEYLEHPERKKGLSKHTKLESFIAAVDRFRDTHSAVFLDDFDRTAPKLLAVFDYHEPTADQGHARFGEHRAEYAFPVSEEWKAWTSIAGKSMSQTDFAVFLEDRILDVLAPEAAGKSAKDFAEELGINLASQARLLELSKGLAVSVDKRVAQAVNLSTGESQFNFAETHNDKDGAPLKVPGGFVIGIPIFRGGDRYPIPVRLRYRVSGGSVVWSLSLRNTDKIFDTATDEAAALVAEKTMLPVYRGRPE
jgi:uncharacterized protein YfdQ (DUF2303 family)